MLSIYKKRDINLYENGDFINLYENGDFLG